MAISNSYHTSAKAHAITSASKLSSVQKHNARGYFAWDYDSRKIHNLIGSASSLSQDTKDYINQKFASSIEEYNAKQRQKCRRITATAFEYFEMNKSTDIANETILQIGDMDFWEQYRIEKEVKRNRKTYVIKSYPEEIKEVMDRIFRLQAEAYEQIYKTHGHIILKKIMERKESAEAYIQSIDPDLRWKYEQLFLQPKKREGLLKSMQLSDRELEGYEMYFRAKSDLSAIEKKKLIERTSSGGMEIKLINLVAHYDEWSPHSHAISVCSTSGYSRGLNQRVAKSVVLNKWSLEVIQDRMREIAIEEMSKHPDLFQDLQWQDKGEGRNKDYRKEKYIRMRQRKLQEHHQKINLEIEQKETELSQLKMEVSGLQEQKKDVQQKLADIVDEYAAAEKKIEQQKEEIRKWDDMLYVIEDEKEYIAEANECEETVNYLQSLCDALILRKSPLRDKNIEQALIEAFRGFYDALCTSLTRQRKYEVFNSLPEAECKSVPLTKAKIDLDDQIAGAKTKIPDKTRQSIMHESTQKKSGDPSR